MAKLEISIVADIDAVEDLIEEIKKLQTYKLGMGDEQILVDRDDVVKIFTDHVKAKQREPERKTGQWEEIGVIADAYDISGVKTWASRMKCDQCGFTTMAIEGHFSPYNFCPNCGARMEVEHDSNKTTT